MKHLIITGAYGLIGSNLLDTMPKFLKDVRVTKIKCDAIPEDLAKADYIIHAAGYGQPLKFSQDKIKTLEINTLTTTDLFYYLKPGGKFLFVSSSEVYSGAPPPYKETDIGTTNPSHPRACYIEGKRSGEAICHIFKEQGIDVKIVRLSLAYGHTKLGDTRVLNQFIEQGMTGEIKLRDWGTAIRTYCYVKDAVELMWRILLDGKDVVYNVGGFSTTTIADLAYEIGKLTNAKVTLPKENIGLQDAPEDVRLDMNHTLKEFDQSFTPLARGLKLTVEKYV